MYRIFRRTAAFLLLLLWLPISALALTGQNISTFLAYYKDNISFINENEDRHMLPIELEVSELNDGRKQYSVVSDALLVTVTTDAMGIIEACDIRILYPEGAQPGNSLDLDYKAGQYHGLAFITAMHGANTAVSRFYLAQEINTALNENHGVYERQLGSYTISCIKVAGEGAVFTFTNDGIEPAQNAPDDGTVTPEPIEEDEMANYG